MYCTFQDIMIPNSFILKLVERPCNHHLIYGKILCVGFYVAIEMIENIFGTIDDLSNV